ncbi:MAG: hypothetical protein NT090_23595 [Acidobacteria bacterium]|nr:hypothetical protein [Acidobacteriota bacterium]
MNRRQDVVLAGSAPALWGAALDRVRVRAAASRSFRRVLAERELLRGLERLLPGKDVGLAGADFLPGAGDTLFELRTDAARFPRPESYAISRAAQTVTLAAGNEQSLLYAVFDFLERQGVFFGIDGESYPLDATGRLVLPEANQPWIAAPRFAVRGLLPWPDFLNCITVYNDEDFRAYFEAMLRMRFNTFGMHVYTGAQQWAESYLSFEFAGAGHLAFLDQSASHRWGYLPQRTSRYTMGGSQFYAGETFASDATLGRDPWEIAERTQALLARSLAYARKLGLAVGVGFEPYQVPDEIWRALPPEVKPEQLPGRQTRGARFDIESVTAKKMLETRLAQLLEAYPEVDHVWLWEDEGANWESRRTGIPISATPFRTAYDFLRRHAPAKRLVVAGWGGVARHFADLDKRLPKDVVFSCLSDSLGWDPIHEVFGKLEGRQRWPIPWLEDDPGMWLAQFHVNRFHKDLNLAAGYGCQGMIGIHWRHRIVDPTAGFQARFSWDQALTPETYYRAYARTQAAPDRAGRLAATLEDADRYRKLLSTFTGETGKDGHAVTHEFSGDYNEAFTIWSNYQPDPQVAASQREALEALRGIARGAKTAYEKERLAYLAGHVEFMVPYTEAWTLAHGLHQVLARAGKLKKDGQAGEAREVVKNDGVPLWLKLAPQVRQAMLAFQQVVATRNDLGTLTSMHNKFVRIALVRLRLSIQEWLGELPPETEKLLEEVTGPDASAPVRLFVPTRPTLLGRGERVRILIVAPGGGTVRTVMLHTRLRGAGKWTATPAKLLGRRTYQAMLGPLDGAELAEYYVSAAIGGAKLTAPPDAPVNTYCLTLAG